MDRPAQNITAGGTMGAMVLHARHAPLVWEERPIPEPGPGEILIRVEACAVCRTDLHVVDGELDGGLLPVIPGHEIVGRIEAIGPGVTGLAGLSTDPAMAPSLGERVGVPWLGQTCGRCRWCLSGRENLCEAPAFTGFTRDGGFATHVIANAGFSFPLPDFDDPVAAAPLMCAGLIGWRCLRMAGEADRVGLYGFGAAAHLLTQVLTWQGRKTYAFTKPGDAAAQAQALRLGATWAGASQDSPPEKLDAAILFAPVGGLVPLALRALDRGGRVVCGGIHMSDIPSFPYDILWEEREIRSVANLTRADAREFLALAPQARIRPETVRYPLKAANQALEDLRAGRFQGAAVLIP